MSEYNFLQRKNDVLGKKDKSYAEMWDERIRSLCEKINKSPNYYTTSSCSGRILLMVDQEKKGAGLFIWVSHDKINLKELKEALLSFKGKELLKFKCEPPILHIVCKNLSFAEEILEKGQKSGWKNSGIINLKRNVVVELHGTEKLEFPIFREGKFLVDDEFLELVARKSNKKLEKGWKRIGSLNAAIS
ncbi:MAG: tRNA wybutosine-synthesizing 3 family protein [archaeon]|nr:tRNA wybutosine-synthesizing 3 family protein [archaeon]